MNRAHFFKLLVIMILVIGVGGTMYYWLLVPPRNHSTPESVPVDPSFGWKFPATTFLLAELRYNLAAHSTLRASRRTSQGLPVRLKIPAIGVNSAIEDAVITPEGRMDMPIGSTNVAWFSLGPLPGQRGSAVIGGHFGQQNGVPFVFYNLNKLKSGDKIYIVDDKGTTLTFVVQSMRSFDRNADATTVFTSTDGRAHLNLVACEGIWNKVDGSYPSRLVVFAEAISL